MHAPGDKIDTCRNSRVRSAGLRKPRLESTAKRALQMYDEKTDVAEGFEQEEASGNKSAAVR